MKKRQKTTSKETGVIVKVCIDATAPGHAAILIIDLGERNHSTSEAHHARRLGGASEIPSVLVLRLIQPRMLLH